MTAEGRPAGAGARRPNPAWVHAKARAAAIVRRPVAWWWYGFAALNSMIFWWAAVGGGVPMRYGMHEDPGAPTTAFDRVFQLGVIVFWPGLLSLSSYLDLAAPNRRAGEMPRPLPALPVGRTTRVVVEAAVALALVLALRTVGAIAYGLLRPALGDPAIGIGDVTAYLRGTAIGLAITTPPLLLWCSRDGRGRGVQLRVLLVALLLEGAGSLGWMSTLGGCLAVGAALSAFALWLGQQPSLAALAWHGMGRARWTTRTRRTPFAALVADFVRRPLTQAPLYAALLFAAMVVDRGPLAAARFGGQTIRHWVVLYASMFFMMAVVLRPAGGMPPAFFIFSPPATARAWFSAPWLRLPVRPEWVARAVYLHTLVTGFGWLVVLLGAALLTIAIDGGGWPVAGLAAVHPKTLHMLAIFATIPSLASASVAVAAGRRAMAMAALGIGTATLVAAAHAVLPLLSGAVGWALLGMLAVLGGTIGLPLLRRGAVR